MEQIKIIPKDLLCIIPKFEGDSGMLNLFIRKCQYIYDAFADEKNAAQITYIFHALSSRLYGRAANLLSVREDINTWDGLRDILIQHFGDSRSEESMALELEHIKIRTGESYTEFYRRIQLLRSTIFAKLNSNENEGFRAAKIGFYNNMALNAFMYNLSEDLVHVVCHNKCADLESAFKVVSEEENFMSQYKAKHQQGSYRPNLQPQPVAFSHSHGTLFGGSSFPNQSIQSVQGFGTTSAKPSLFGSGPQSSTFGAAKPASLTFGGAPPQIKNNNKGFLFGNPPQTISIMMANQSQNKANENTDASTISDEKASEMVKH